MDGASASEEILDDRNATAPFDFVEARRAIIESAGENRADHARSEGFGGGAEQRVDRRPRPVFSRSARQVNVRAGDDQVMVAGRDIDAASLEPLAVDGVMSGEPAHVVQQGRQQALAAADVQHDQNGRGKVGRQRREDLAQGVNATLGSADRHHAARRLLSHRRYSLSCRLRRGWADTLRRYNPPESGWLPRWRS